MPSSPGNRASWHGVAGGAEVISLNQVPVSETPRFSTQIDELDRVLGGGLVEGSVVLLGGDPGIGKSTILLQCLSLISQDHEALYVTGEESPQQISLRAGRLRIPADNMKLLSSADQLARRSSAYPGRQHEITQLDLCRGNHPAGRHDQARGHGHRFDPDNI